MPAGKLIVICQSGGKFTSASDGSLSYTGGDAHALSVNRKSKFHELKLEMADMWNYDPDSLTIKYFLPNNKQTLITVSSDKDIQRMIDFHEDSKTVDLFVMTNEISASEASVMPCSRLLKIQSLCHLYQLAQMKLDPIMLNSIRGQH